jgi:P27 family predicted phage terminase small subunit
MQARPGPSKKAVTIQPSAFEPPPTPDNLTPSQLQTWEEIVRNPFLTNLDKSMIGEFIRVTTLADNAFDALMRDGLYVDDAKGSLKTHPAYKVWRDSTARVLKMRDLLLMTPKARVSVNAAQPVPEDTDDVAALAD